MAPFLRSSYGLYVRGFIKYNSTQPHKLCYLTAIYREESSHKDTDSIFLTYTSYPRQDRSVRWIFIGESEKGFSTSKDFHHSN